MDQSTENLIYTSCNQLDGYVNEAASLSGAPSLTFDLTTDSHTISELGQEDVAPSFVLGPYNQRKRLLSCIIENWQESDSYNSLPAEINQSPREVVSGIGGQKPFSWEAEDVTDYITTLDESCILDIESYEEIDRISEQHKWNPQTYGPIYEPLLKPGEQVFDRPLSSQLNYETFPMGNSSNNIMTKSGGPDEKYPKIMTATSYEAIDPLENVGKSQEEINCPQYSSTDNLLSKVPKDPEEFLYLNPAFNHSKCRTPLPVLSMNSSFYDETTSMNSSMHEMNPGTMSQMNGTEKSFNCGKFNAVNPLETSIVDLDGNKSFGEDQVSNMQVTAENGEFE